MGSLGFPLARIWENCDRIRDYRQQDSRYGEETFPNIFSKEQQRCPISPSLLDLKFTNFHHKSEQTQNVNIKCEHQLKYEGFGSLKSLTIRRHLMNHIPDIFAGIYLMFNGCKYLIFVREHIEKSSIFLLILAGILGHGENLELST